MSEIAGPPLISRSMQETMAKICEVIRDDMRPLVEERAAGGNDELREAARLAVQPLNTIACGYATGYVDEEQLSLNAKNIRDLKVKRVDLEPREKDAMAMACDAGVDLQSRVDDTVNDLEDVTILPERADLHVQKATKCALHAALNIPCSFKHDVKVDDYSDDAECVERFVDELTVLKQSGVQKSYLAAYGSATPEE